MKTTTISVRGDRRYVATLRTLASSRDMTIAELVRSALDAQYNADIERIQRIFFADDGSPKDRRATCEPEAKTK